MPLHSAHVSAKTTFECISGLIIFDNPRTRDTVGINGLGWDGNGVAKKVSLNSLQDVAAEG